MQTQELDIDGTLLSLTLIAVLVGVASVVLFMSFIIRKTKIFRGQLQAELEHQKKLHAMELKALRGQMNPHFVHNSLNAIQYYIQRHEVELSENYLVKFSKLIRLFFEYSRRQHITIKDEVHLLESYLDIEKLRFEEKLSYSVEVDPRIEQDEHILPSMLLQPLVENAVNHGVFHKNESGNIDVRFNYIDNASFEVTIQDDGIGLNKAKELYARSSRNYQSRSSAVLEERLELLNQTGNWNVQFSLQDRSEFSNETGTLARLIFNYPEES